MSRKKSKIKIREILEFVSEKEEIGWYEFPQEPDYTNLCLVSCGGYQVHDVYVDARIGNRL